MPSHKLRPWEIAAIGLRLCIRLSYANMLLHGPSGTGKSYFAKKHGLRPEERVFPLYMGEFTASPELVGNWITNHGTFEFHEGPVTRAWRHPVARLLIDEADKASQDAIPALMQVTDNPDHASILLPTGEEIRPQPNFFCIATMNSHPDRLPEAFRDRFTVQVEINEIHPEALRSLSPRLRNLASNMASRKDGRHYSIRKWQAFDEALALIDQMSSEANSVKFEDVAYSFFGKEAADLIEQWKMLDMT